MKFILNKDELTIERTKAEECKYVKSGSIKYYKEEVIHDESWDNLDGIEAIVVKKESGTVLEEGISIGVINDTFYFDREEWGSYSIGFKGFLLEYDLTTDTEIVDGKKYYTREGEEGSYTYVLVQNPDIEDINSYYEAKKSYQISTNFENDYAKIGAGQIKIINGKEIPPPTEWEQYLSQVTEFINNGNEILDNAEELIEELEEVKTAEAERKENEEAREQAEEDRTLAEGIRVAHETTRELNEEQRNENEGTRQDNEQTRQGNENVREENEEDREDAEAIRQQNEEARKNAENARKTAETNRANAEATRAENEEDRQTAETARAQNETTRNQNEVTRNENETTRQAQEGAREESETARNTAETSRNSAETNRASAETIRVSNENTRIYNEEVRQGKINKVASMLKDATQTGTSIHTTDSANWYGDLNPEGFSRQNTRSGKNKFNKKATPDRLNKVTTTELDTGVRTNITQAGDYCGATYILLDMRDYAGKTVRIKTTMTASASNLVRIATGYCSSTGGSISNQTSSTTENLTITVPSEVTEGKEYLGLVLYANYQGTAAVGDYAEFKDLIVTIDNADMTYEEYGVSPSPDYPSEIRNLEGINKFNKNDTTQFLENINVDSSSGKVQSVAGNTTICVPCKPSTIYTISKKISARFVAGTYPTVPVPDDILNNKQANNSGSSITVTSGVNDNYIIAWVYYANADTLTKQEIIDSIQIVEGTEAKEFAPYNSLRFKQVGKNLAWTGWAEDFVGRINDNTKANIEDYGGRHCLHFLPSAGSGSYDTKYFFKTNWKENTQYTISYDMFNYSSASPLPSIKPNLNIVYTDGTHTEFGSMSYNSWNHIHFISSENKTIKQIQVAYYSGQKYLDLDTFMVVEGVYTAETIGDYEPYKEHIIDFPLLEWQKMYEESTLIDEGMKNIRKQIVFNGTENWAEYSSGIYYCTNKHFGRETGYENPSTFKCTHFTPAIGTATTNGISSTKFATYINMDTTTISDLSSFKTWLSNNNVLVEYLSAEPEIIPYTEAQQTAYNELQNIDTYQYVNNIELISNEETNMTFNYKQDIQMQIKEEINPVKQAIIALGGVVE